jgi:hypothetical protein
MAGDIRLVQFNPKSSPVGTDIVYMGDSSTSFDEVKVTLSSIGTYLMENSATQLQTIYVSTKGNDSIGTGTIVNPFASRAAAISHIGSNATATNPFVIVYDPGSYTFSTFNLEPFIYDFAYTSNTVLITVTGGFVTLDQTAFSGVVNAKSGVNNINFVGGTGIDILTSSMTGSAAFTIIFGGVNAGGANFINSSSFSGRMTITLRNNTFTGTTFNGVNTISSLGGNQYSTVALRSDQASTTGTFENDDKFGSLSINDGGSSNNLTASFTTSNPPSSVSITNSGTAIVNISFDSLTYIVPTITGSPIINILPQVFKTNNNTIDDGGGGATIAAVGTSTVNIGNSTGPSTTNIDGSVNINTTGSGITMLGASTFLGTINQSLASGNVKFIQTAVTTGNEPIIFMQVSRTGLTAVQNGDRLGQFDFEGYDGTQYVSAGQIFASVDGTVGTNQVPGRLDFYLANSSGTLTNYLNIHASGQVSTMNNTVDDGNGGFSFATSGSSTGTIGGGTYSGIMNIGNVSAPNVGSLSSNHGLLTYDGHAPYAVGTVSTSGSSTTITGSGTTFTSAMTGGVLFVTSGANIGTSVGVTFVSTTSLTADQSVTIAAGSSFKLYYGAIQLSPTTYNFGTGATVSSINIGTNAFTGTITLGNSTGPSIINTSGNMTGNIYVNNGSSNRNVGITMSSLPALAGGNDCVFMGYRALNALTSGTQHTALGYDALFQATSGNANTAVGFSAGSSITTGSANVCIGAQADVNSNTASNRIVIGDTTTGTNDNQCIIGNGSITSIINTGAGTCALGTTANAFSSLVLGTSSSSTIVINPASVASARTYTLQDSGTNSDIVTNTYSGVIDFNTVGAITIGDQTNTTGLTLNTNTSSTLTIGPVSSSIAIGNTTGALTATTVAINTGNHAGTVTIGHSNTALILVSNPNLVGGSNQLSFQPGGSGNSITFTAANPASNRTYTIPDALANSNMVLSSQSSVTQLTSISTGVTITGPTGNITTVSLSTVASTTAGTFTVTNTFYTSSSQVINVQASYGGATTGTPYAFVSAINSGSNTFNITVRNIDTSAALNGTLIISMIIC